MFEWMIYQVDDETGKWTALGIVEAPTMAEALESGEKKYGVDLGELEADRYEE